MGIPGPSSSLTSTMAVTSLHTPNWDLHCIQRYVRTLNICPPTPHMRTMSYLGVSCLGCKWHQ